MSSCPAQARLDDQTRCLSRRARFSHVSRDEYENTTPEFLFPGTRKVPGLITASSSRKSINEELRMASAVSSIGDIVTFPLAKALAFKGTTPHSAPMRVRRGDGTKNTEDITFNSIINARSELVITVSTSASYEMIGLCSDLYGASTTTRLESEPFIFEGVSSRYCTTRSINQQTRQHAHAIAHPHSPIVRAESQVIIDKQACQD